MRSTLAQPPRQDAPIDEQSRVRSAVAHKLRVRILGCSGGIGRNLRTTSMMLNHNVLIDMGTGVGDLTLDELNQVDTLFLTHSHLDHTAMLPLFLDTTFDARVHKPLTVYALQETIDAVRTHLFNDIIWPDFELLPNVANPVVQFVAIEPGEVTYVDDLGVRAIEAFHAVPALGFCFEVNTGVFAFSGDTMTNDTLWPVLNSYPKIEALVVEVSFPNAQELLARTAGHYTPQMLAADLNKLKHSPRIWVTAMKPGFNEQIFDEVLAAIPNRDVRRLQRGDEFLL